MDTLILEDYTEYNTDSKVHFLISLTDESARWDEQMINRKFKLSKLISLNNMHLFDRNGHITKYPSAVSILQEFYVIRLEFYEKRKVSTYTLSTVF